MTENVFQMRSDLYRIRTERNMLACITLGLLAGLLYAGHQLKNRTPPAPVERCAADVLQLDPTAISAARHQVYEL